MIDQKQQEMVHGFSKFKTESNDIYKQEPTQKNENLAEELRRQQIQCSECYQLQQNEQCFFQQLSELKLLLQSTLNQQSQINTTQRIQNEINQFIKLNHSNIKLARIQFESSGLILQRAFIIFIKGTDKLEGGIYPFLVTYPANYPFSTIQMRTLFHFYHPHIYPEGQLCIPDINPHSKVQTSSLSDIVQSWYAILHRDINLSSLANVEVNELYDENFIKAQAKLFSFSNPIYQKWNLQAYWDQEDQDNQGQHIVQF
ncbi:Ubiquitin-conjugating enzyme E2 U [Paramecium bursaria]